MYNEVAPVSGFGEVIVRDPSSSILPNYMQISGTSSVLPRYTSIGADGQVLTIPEVKIVVDEKEEQDRKTAMIGGTLFFTGLVLGFIFGSTVGVVKPSKR